ncbi:hypothetical protein J6590_026516 [Homalodisca vitripennis]|nr:hypothetical protein J6590_026516 [Homalodisca vitripennis]
MSVWRESECISISPHPPPPPRDNQGKSGRILDMLMREARLCEHVSLRLHAKFQVYSSFRSRDVLRTDRQTDNRIFYIIGHTREIVPPTE